MELVILYEDDCLLVAENILHDLYLAKKELSSFKEA